MKFSFRCMFFIKKVHTALIFNNSDLQAINKHQTISDF